MTCVILAEDEDDVRYALSLALRKSGFEVIEAKNGKDNTIEQGLASADVVVTDILMPDRDGIELIVDLRARAPDLPVIAISGGGRVSGADYLETAEALGVFATFQKPFDKNDLIAAVRAAAA